MKRVLTLLLIFTLVFTIPAFAKDTASVVLNDAELNFTDTNGNTVNAELTEGRTMVPLRKIFEALGATIDWNDATKTVTAVKGERTIILTIGSKSASINGETITLDVAPYIVEGRTLVPLRFIAESFNCKVGWDQETKTAIIVDSSKEREAFLSTCTNFKTFLESDIEPDGKYQIMNMRLNYSGKGKDIKETLSLLNNNIPITAFDTDSAVYIKFEENIFGKEIADELGIDLSDYYISVPIDEISDSELSAALSESTSTAEVTFGTYQEEVEMYKTFTELLNNNNFKISTNGNKTTYSLTIKDYIIDAEDPSIRLNISIEVIVTDGTASHIDVAFTLRETSINEEITIAVSSDIKYTNTPHAEPNEEYVLPLEDLLMAILFASMAM